MNDATNQVEKILEDLSYKGFKADFHREELTKALQNNPESFSLKDQSFSKKVNFQINFKKNESGKYTYSVTGHHKELGHYAKFPLNGAFPRKDVFENFLEGRAFLTSIFKKKDEVTVKEAVWLSMSENPCTSQKDADNMWSHAKSYSPKYFSIKEDFFGHKITPEERKDLEKGRTVNFTDCVDVNTGEILSVTGVYANPEKQKLSYDEKNGTGQFVTPDELKQLKDAMNIKQDKGTSIEEPVAEEQSTKKKRSRSVA